MSTGYRWPKRTNCLFRNSMPSTYQDKQLQAIRNLEAAAATGNGQSTIVPMLSDAGSYAADDRLCLAAVCFLGDRLGSLIADSFASQLRAVEPHHYFYPPQSLHVTIQNLRTISTPPTFDDAHIETARQVFERVVAAHRSFDLQLAGALKLPTSLSICGISDEALPELVLDLRNGLAEAGIPDDKKYNGDVIFANVTFCRYTCAPSSAFLNVAQQAADSFSATLPVHAIDLIITNAACHPEKTRLLHRFELQPQ